MASFDQTKYEANNGDIYAIKLSFIDAAAAGSPPTGAVTQPHRVKVSKTNREVGIRPRGVRLVRQIAAGANDFLYKYKFLPVLTAAQWGTGGFAIDQTITLDTVEWTVKALVPEDY